MEAKELIAAVEAAGHEARSYSGRGMYGRECVGVETDSPPFLLGLALGARLGPDAADELAGLRVATDSMGYGTIVYFPEVLWPDPEEEEEGGAPFGTCGDCPTCGSLSPGRCGHNDDVLAEG